MGRGTLHHRQGTLGHRRAPLGGLEGLRAEVNNEQPGTRKAFAEEAMASRGHPSQKNQGVRSGYAGIQLKAEECGHADLD